MRFRIPRAPRGFLFIFASCALNFVLAPFGALTAGDSPSSSTVTLESGVLEGMRLSTTPNVVVFLGVPYAAPPIGDLR